MSDYRVNVYENGYKEEVVARVKYNSELDVWDGHNWTNGGTGRHLGITKLKDNRYVLIYGTQWQGEKDYGIIVSDNEALQAILKSEKMELLDKPKFKELKVLAAEKGLLCESEYTDDEEVTIGGLNL